MKNNHITIYTDGASRGNPGPGGWGALIVASHEVFELAGNATTATNNQMELAAVEAVLSDARVLAHRGEVVVYSDSSYVINGISSWMYGWEKNGWITSTKTPVENKGQWQSLLRLAREYGSRLVLLKVKGHAGDIYNERCDQLAVGYALGKKPLLFSGTLSAYKLFLEEQVGIKDSVKKTTTKKSNSAVVYAYVSLVNGNVYSDKTWAACEKRVKGSKGARYKKVFSKTEETELIQEYTLASIL